MMNDVYYAGETSRQILQQQHLENTSIPQNLLLKENDMHLVTKKDIDTSFIDINKMHYNRITTHDLTNYNNYMSETESIQNKSMDEICDESDKISKIEKFFNQILELENEASFKETSGQETKSHNCFYCINCCIKFETNGKFLDHCNISDDLIKPIHGNFRLNKDQEKFLASNLVIYRNNDKKINQQQKVDTKISVFLLNNNIKRKFIENYSHDLLAANEETAICLEDLNNSEYRNNHSRIERITTENEEYCEGYNEENGDTSNQFETYENLNEKKEEFSENEHSLLFVDYSIVQMSRILEKIKSLYNMNSNQIYQANISDDENGADYSDDEEDSMYKEINVNTKYEQIDLDSDSMNSSYDEKGDKSSPKATETDKNNNLATLENNLTILNRSKLFADSFKQQSNQSVSKSVATNDTKSSTQQKPQQSASPNKPTATVHSRNACKKLKCPKCNWHYKYRETLDIHMREKHSTDVNKDLSQKCIYCLENTQHPRLGRGEQYKCGYKPYRCDICDYSTTTKGNLSIHMQSDKHVNNLKEVKTNNSSNNDDSTEQSNDNELDSLNFNEATSKSASNSSDNEQLVDTFKASQMADIQSKCNILNNFETDDKSIHKQLGHGLHTNTSINIDNSGLNSQLNANNGSVSKMNAKSVKSESINSEELVGKTTGIENQITSIFCPLCQTKFNDQNSLGSHLKEAHNVINEEALKILVNSAKTFKKTDGLSHSEPTIKKENVFPSISLDQLPKLNEFDNNRLNKNVNQNEKLINQKQQDMSKVATKLNTPSNNNNNTINNDIQINRSRSASRSTTNTSDDNDDVISNKIAHSHQNQIQVQLDTFISSKSNKSNRAYRKLISQLCQQYTVNNKINASFEISTESDPDALIKCYACNSNAFFPNLTDLKAHLEDEHSVSLSPSDTNALIYKYIKDTLRDFSQNLSEDLIQRSLDNFDSKLKVSKQQQPIGFSAETLLNSKKNSQEMAGLSQNQALVNYLTTFGKNNGTSMTSTDPSTAFLNQFLLPLMFQQQQQTAKNSSGDLKDSPCPSPTHNQDEDDSEMNSMHYSNQGHNNSSDMNNSRRRRTRITEDQLKVLRQYFDINKSPSDEQITDIAQRTQLQAKVIKHWFRNTLFKERQKDKDSPYNFNNPPVTQLNIEEYEKTGKITNCANSDGSADSGNSLVQSFLAAGNGLSSMKNELLYESVVKAAAAAVVQQQKSSDAESAGPVKQKLAPNNNEITNDKQIANASRATSSTLSTSSSSSTSSVNDNDEDFYKNNSSTEVLHSSHIARNINGSSLVETNSKQQRPNRTKFSNVQIRALNQLFKQQRYPKDEQVAKLGKQLHLKQRVITVWFQNARQKARKSNHPGSATNSQFTGSNKSPSTSSQDYENNEEDAEDYDDPDNTYNNACDDDEGVDEDNNNYYDTDFDDNQSQVSLTESNKQVRNNQEQQHQPPEISSSSSAIQNANALQLAMSFLAAHQGQVPKDQSFAALAAAFNSSILKNGLTNGHDNSLGDATKRVGGEMEDEDEEDNTNGYDENELSDEEQAVYSSNLNGSGLINSAMINSSSSNSNAKRLRTTILPEQQEYLMQKYQLDQNPSRKMLDEIAREVRLKKRVVQVWFQNTRARERKGIIKITSNQNVTLSNSSSSNVSGSQGLKPQQNQSAAFLKRSGLESHLNLKNNYSYEANSHVDVDQFQNSDIHHSVESNNNKLLSTKEVKRNQSPSLSPAPHTQQVNQLQNFYTNLLLQQQQHAYQPFNGLQSPQSTSSNTANNGINSLLMSQLFNQLQQKGQKPDSGSGLVAPESTPLDLVSSSGANTSNLTALSSIALAAAAAYNKNPNFTREMPRSRSNSSTNGENNYKIKPSAAQQQQQRRVRTQMTQYQVNVMRLIFAEYKTPTMNECEQMGREINLKKRVVQVWFQNARAKEKKSHPLNSKSILFSNTANNDLSSYEFAPDECLICGVKYNNSTGVSGVGGNSQAQREHLFSKMHVNKLIKFVTNVAIENGADLNAGKFYTGFHNSSGGGDYKRKFEDDEEDNESGSEDENDCSNGDNDDNLIEYGDSDGDTDNFDYSNNTKNVTNLQNKNQPKLKTSNDSSFSSTSSSNNLSNNNTGNNFNDENDENNTTSSMSPSSILKSLSQGNTNGNPFDLNRLMQMSASRPAKTNLTAAEISTSTASSPSFQQSQQQQQQNIYNYLLYSNLLNNGKI